MEFEECRSEASIGLQHSISTPLCDDEQCRPESCDKPLKNFSSPTGKRKRKPNSPPSSPNAVEGFGDSEAGDILKQFPDLEELFTIVRKVGEVYDTEFVESFEKRAAVSLPVGYFLALSFAVMFTARGKDNVIGIETAYRKNDHIVFVLPYVPHQKFQVKTWYSMPSFHKGISKQPVSDYD
ncbi:hypothetical protein QZH41_005994 [Actinostola sp. cb2023]|nr:hypothetical protein QZH41_005994 [Actinostola sp. cb2023]